MKYLFFLVLTISLSATSCKKDKDTNSIQLKSEDVVGTWNLNEGSQVGKYGIGLQGQFAFTDFVGTLSDIAMTVTFNADSTWTSSGTATLTIVTTEPGGMPETESDQLTNGTGSGTYFVSNGKLTMIGLNFAEEEDEPITFNVNSFVPDSKLEISNFTKNEESDPGSGFSFISEITTNIKFVR